MILTQTEIKRRGIVVGATEAGWQPSTYDATVGSIVTKNGRVHDKIFPLPPRGIAWVLSRETFCIPKNVTGLATLKTTWTKQGVLTLTLGIVNPGWTGPLATAVINFGRSPFTICEGDPFFRILFHEHNYVDVEETGSSHPEYFKDLIRQTRNFSDTFLTIDTLAPEVAKSMFSMPRLAIYLGISALIVSILSFFAPAAQSLMEGRGERLRSLEERVSEIESQDRYRRIP